MVVVTGPATAISWLAVAGFLFLQRWSPTELASTSTFSFGPLPGGGRTEAVSTTPVLSTSTSFLRGSVQPEVEYSSVTWAVTIFAKFLPASFAQVLGWLVTALFGAAVGRCTRRRESPESVLQAGATASQWPRFGLPASRTRSSLSDSSPASGGGVITPSTRRALQNGGLSAKEV